MSFECKIMVSTLALVVLLTTLQLVQPELLGNCSNPVEAEIPNCGKGNLLHDDHAKNVQVGFDDIFHLDQPSRIDVDHRVKREIEDIIETDAEIFSNGPGTSLNIQSMPMTTLDDSDPSSGEKELVEDQDQAILESIKHDKEGNTEVNETDVKEDETEKEEKSLYIKSELQDIESAEQDSISNLNTKNESEVDDFPVENVQGVPDSLIDPTMAYEEVEPEETDAKGDVKVDGMSEDVPKVINKNDEVEIMESLAKSSDISHLGKIKQSDDEDEDSAESGSGADEDDMVGFPKPVDDETKYDESLLNQLYEKVPESQSVANDNINVEDGLVEEEDGEEAPLSAPNQHSSASNPSINKDEIVESDVANEGTIMTERMPHSSEKNPSVFKDFDVESESVEEETLKSDFSPISTSLGKPPAITPDKDYFGSGDDTNDEEMTTLVETEGSGEISLTDTNMSKGLESDKNQVGPLSVPIENPSLVNSDDMGNFNIETSDDEDIDDVSPIPNPSLEDMDEPHSPVDDKKKIVDDLPTIMGVIHPSGIDFKMSPIDDNVEGSGNSSTDDIFEDSEEDYIIPAVISRGINNLDSSLKDKDLNVKKEGPHVKGIAGEFLTSNPDEEIVDTPHINNQNLNTILASENGTNIKEVDSDGSNRIVIGDPSTDQDGVKDPNSINEIGVKTDDKNTTSKANSPNPTTSSGSYVVLGVILLIIIALFAYTVIKNKRQKEKKKNIRNVPKHDDAGTELKEIESLLNRDARNTKGPVTRLSGESDSLLTSKGREYDEVPLPKMFYPYERPDLPSSRFDPRVEIPTELSEVTVEHVPRVFAAIPVYANGGNRIPRMTQSDSGSDGGSDDDSSDDRGSWVYGNSPLETTKIKTYIDHDSIPKTPIVIVKRGGSAVEI